MYRNNGSLDLIKLIFWEKNFNVLSSVLGGFVYNCSYKKFRNSTTGGDIYTGGEKE